MHRKKKSKNSSELFSGTADSIAADGNRNVYQTEKPYVLLRLDSDAQSKAVQESKLFTVTEKLKEDNKSLLPGKSMSILWLPQENLVTEEAKDKNSLRKISGYFP